MTNKELKKWLKRCGSTDSLCTGCPFGVYELCFDEIKLAALALIKKQEKEINRLKTECTLLDDELRNARQETIDVLNKVKERSYCDNTFTDGKWHRYVLVDDINEMIEGLTKCPK